MLLWEIVGVSNHNQVDTVEVEDRCEKKIYGFKSDANSLSQCRDMPHIIWNAEVQYNFFTTTSALVLFLYDFLYIICNPQFLPSDFLADNFVYTSLDFPCMVHLPPVLLSWFERVKSMYWLLV